ncbi:HNH endonuclease [Vibrio phage K460]
MSKLIYGLGINDAGYPVKLYESTQVSKGKQKQTLVWFCPYYDKWKGMLRRCLSEEYKKKHPTYKECKVVHSWLTFSTFKRWCQEYESCYKVSVRDTDLDKDFIKTGNTIYCPEHCCLIPNGINKFLTENNANRGDLPLGVSYRKGRGEVVGLRARCKNPFTLKEVSCGCFKLGQEVMAHQAWKEQKHKFAVELVGSGFTTDRRIIDALLVRYGNQ